MNKQKKSIEDLKAQETNTDEVKGGFNKKHLKKLVQKQFDAEGQTRKKNKGHRKVADRTSMDMGSSKSKNINFDHLGSVKLGD